MNAPSSLLSSEREALSRLRLLRVIAIFGTCLTIVALSLVLPVPARWDVIAAAAGYALLANAWTARRCGRADPVAHRDVFIWLAADIAVLALLLYFHGGPDNPLTDLLLVPIAFAAVVLPLPYAAAIATGAATAHALLFVFVVPVAPVLGETNVAFFRMTDIAAHVLVALLMAYIVFALMQALRRQAKSIADASIAQALTTLLNNAADASPHDIELTARWSVHELDCEVLDRGPGLPAGRDTEIGQPYFSTKPHAQGMGLGLHIATVAMRRFGGGIDLTDRPGGGVRARMQLRLDELVVDAPSRDRDH